MKSVCKGCQDRFVGCHSTCDRYLEAKTEHNATAAMIREKQMEQLDTDRYIAKAIAASKYRRGLRKK